MEGKEGAVKEEGAMVGHLEAKIRTRRKDEDVGTRRNQRNEGFNHSHDQNFGDQRGRGRGSGQGLGRGGFNGTCFHCNEEGHRAFECPQRQGRTNR